MVRNVVVLVLLIACWSAAVRVRADEPPSAVASVMKLLKSGRVPEQRLGSIVEIVGTRGNEHDLAYLFERAASGDWPVELREKTLRLLLDAARNRKVVPQTDLAPLARVIGDRASTEPLRLAGIQLAGAADAAAVGDVLDGIARDAAEPVALRSAALQSRVAIRGVGAREAIDALSAASQPFTVRAAAVSALAGVDLDAAAVVGAELLQAAGAEDDPAGVVDAFLVRRGGSERLAAAVSQKPPTADVAKLALRHMYSIGRSDEDLVSSLGKVAGIDADPEPLTPDAMQALMAEVAEKGDAHRGEAIFRRGDLSCMKCHAVSAAGGQVGPDLSAVGPISPVDFLINSVMNPDLAIKEAYITRVVATVDGEVLQGILVDRSSERLVLKDATGAVHTIATADIDEEIEGKSLMPKGLVKFMTRAELVDLVRFLSELGRPGDFAIRTTPRFQRYRVLSGAPSELVESIPNDEQFEAGVLRAVNWVPLYAQVDGTLPLDEASRIAGGTVVYIYGEFEVSKAGRLGIGIDSAEGVTAWLDDDSVALTPQATVEAEEGRHRLTLRIDLRQRSSPGVVAELVRVPGSAAEFRPVDGA
jgi:putative heme-binding domain-containing protein